MMEGVNSSMIYCRNFCKCHNVPRVQQKKSFFLNICLHVSFLLSKKIRVFEENTLFWSKSLMEICLGFLKV
jgi:hypothetical protein